MVVVFCALQVEASDSGAGRRPATMRKPDVSTTLRTIVDHLVEVRDERRQWEPRRLPRGAAAQPTGRTALVALALVLSGMASEDPDLKPALDWLAENPGDGTYAIAVRLMLWSRLPERYRPHARRERARLLERFSWSPPGWDYQAPPRPHLVDHSLTQFAFQALADSAVVLEPIPKRVLLAIREGFLRSQNSDGGWAYRPVVTGGGASRGSMTAAALATLALAERASPTTGASSRRVRLAMANAVDWLDRNFASDSHPGHSEHLYYWMHALERASRVTGERRYGDQVWFEGFADTIRTRLLAADSDRGWRVRRGLRVENLAFAAMVLRRGLEPLVFGSFDPDGLDAAPSRLGSVAADVGDRLERRVGWTRLDLRDSQEYWSRFPLVFVHGRVDAGWLADEASPERARLMAYLQGGGLVVAVSADRGRFARRLLESIRRSVPGLQRVPCEPGHALRRGSPDWHGSMETLESPLRVWVAAPSRIVFSTRLDRPCRTTGFLADCCVQRFGVGVGLLRRGDAPESAGGRTIQLIEAGSEAWASPEPGLPGRLVESLKGLPAEATFDVGVVRWVEAADRAAIDRLARLTEEGSMDAPLLVACHASASTQEVGAELLEAGWRIESLPRSASGVLGLFRSPAGAVALLLGPDLLRRILEPGRGRPRELMHVFEILALLDPRRAS